MRTRLILSPLVLLSVGGLTRAQTTVPVSDPNALALAAQALRVVAPGIALSDITIQANATYVTGSDEETGTATLVARGNAQSLVTLNLSGGQRQEIRNGAAGVWVGPDGIAHAMATHTCWTDADWFFPAFSLAALGSDPTLVVNLAGQEVHEGQPVYHLSFLRNISGQTPDVVALVQKLGAIDLYLDASSLLPTALILNLHSDDDAGINLPLEVRFGDYSAVNGIRVPNRIQKYVQNSLVLDLTIVKVGVNAGVPGITFTLPDVSAGDEQ